MATNGLDEYWVPEHVKDYLRKLGFVLPLDDMVPWIRSWDDWMSARGEFYDYRDKDGMGRVYAVHRRSIHPAMCVCKEWGSLLLNEEVKVVCENQKATDWINSFFSSTNFMNAAQATVVRAFGLGTGAWSLWIDLGKRKVRIRHYDARDCEENRRQPARLSRHNAARPLPTRSPQTKGRGPVGPPAHMCFDHPPSASLVFY